MTDIRNDFGLFARSMGIPQTTSESVINGIENSYINPTIIEERRLNVAMMDVFSRLMMDRSIFLGTELCPEVSNIITAQLLYLQSTGDSDITMYINSPGGVVSDGMAIYDVMNYITPNVTTICMGMAASMGAVLLSSGTRRRALPHSSIMIHEPLGGVAPHTKSTDFLIEAEQMKKCKDMLIGVLAKNAGMEFDEMERYCSRDKWLTPGECLPGAFGTKGLIDDIIR